MVVELCDRDEYVVLEVGEVENVGKVGRFKYYCIQLGFRIRSACLPCPPARLPARPCLLGTGLTKLSR